MESKTFNKKTILYELLMTTRERFNKEYSQQFYSDIMQKISNIDDDSKINECSAGLVTGAWQILSNDDLRETYDEVGIDGVEDELLAQGVEFTDVIKYIHELMTNPEVNDFFYSRYDGARIVVLEGSDFESDQSFMMESLWGEDEAHETNY